MPFEYMKAMAELWGRGGQDFAAAQQNFFANMAKAVGQESPSACREPACSIHKA
jgi:hypothetical protein